MGKKEKGKKGDRAGKKRVGGAEDGRGRWSGFDVDHVSELLLRTTFLSPWFSSFATCSRWLMRRNKEPVPNGAPSSENDEIDSASGLTVNRDIYFTGSIRKRHGRLFKLEKHLYDASTFWKIFKSPIVFSRFLLKSTDTSVFQAPSWWRYAHGASSYSCFTRVTNERPLFTFPFSLFFLCRWCFTINPASVLEIFLLYEKSLREQRTPRTWFVVLIIRIETNVPRGDRVYPRDPIKAAQFCNAIIRRVEANIVPDRPRN